MKKFLIYTAVIFMPAALFAQEIVTPPAVDKNAVELVKIIQNAFSGGDWATLVAAALLLLVSFIGKIWGLWKDKESIRPYLKWIALALSGIVGFSVSILSGGTILVALSTGGAALFTGLATVGGWETFGKIGSGILSMFNKDKKNKKNLYKNLKPIMRKASDSGSISMADIRGLGLTVYDEK